ncbi:MAG: dihydrofolate reductase family protein [Anaerolineae bacterium]|nr:dihydrofolate reductase family protein [Anaerolineae bacterium]
MKIPRVIALNTASLDGRLAISRDVLLLQGDARWQAMESWSAPPLGGVFETLRAAYQPGATLEGSGSLVREGETPEPLPPFEGDPEPLYQDYLPPGVVDREGHRGWFTVVDGRGRVRNWIADGGVFGPSWQGWHALVLVGAHTPASYLAALRRQSIPYLIAGSGPVDLRLALGKLRVLLGVTCVLSTAGGRLNGALLRAGLIDELHVEFLPALVGGMDTPSLYDAPALDADGLPVRLELLSCQVTAGGRVWLAYRVVQTGGTG